MKMKETAKRDRYLDLAKELKKQRNMKVMVIPIIDSAPGTVPKSFERSL